MMSLDRDGTVVDTDKGVWQQGRFTWLLGELYNNVEPRRSGWISPSTAPTLFEDTVSILPTGACGFTSPATADRFASDVTRSPRVLPRSLTVNWHKATGRRKLCGERRGEPSRVH